MVKRLKVTVGLPNNFVYRSNFLNMIEECLYFLLVKHTVFISSYRKQSNPKAHKMDKTFTLYLNLTID